MKARQPTPYQINVEYGAQAATTTGAVGVGAQFSISDLNTFVDIPIPGMSAGGQVSITPLPSTGAAGDPIFFQTAGVGTVRISVTTAPGVGNKFNGVYTVQRYS